MRWIPFVLLGVCVSSAALANDSTATIGAGGLVLETTDSIAMISEDLFVSVDAIRVGYRFRNRTAVPVTTVIAFPMPPRRLSDEYGGDVAYPSGFRTTVDGKVVEATLDRRALVAGRDHRATLERLGVPVAPDGINESVAAMDRLAPASKAELLRLGLAGEEQWDDDGTGMKTHLIPLWTVDDRYWWRQTFEPGRDVLIEHRYVPGAGGSVGSAIAIPEVRNSDDGRAMIAHYCIDDAFLAAVDRRTRGAEGSVVPERRVDYILTTGANWAEPIGDFRLVVDKGKPGNLVSFCGEGVSRISPTRFEMRKTNWRPDRDLHVLVLEPSGG